MQNNKAVERTYTLVVREGIDENVFYDPFKGEMRISPEEKIVSTVGLRYDNDARGQVYGLAVKFATQKLNDEQIVLAVRALLPDIRQAAEDIEDGLDRHNLHILSLREVSEGDN